MLRSVTTKFEVQGNCSGNRLYIFLRITNCLSVLLCKYFVSGLSCSRIGAGNKM